MLFRRDRDAPELPPGYYHLVVVAWIFLRGNFLLQLRSRKKVYGAGEWSIPGGAVLHDESREEALIREIHEETGLTINNSNLTFLCREQGEDYFCDAFLCIPEEELGEQVNAPDEVEQLKWFSIKEINFLMESSYISRHSLSYEKALHALTNLGKVV